MLDANIEHIKSLLSVVEVHCRMTRSLEFLGSPLDRIDEAHFDFVMFQFSAYINDMIYVNERKILRKTPGISGSPLPNIIGHDPLLSVPQLHRTNHNLHVKKKLCSFSNILQLRP